MPFSPPRLGAAQDLQCFFRRQCIAQVAEVHQGNDVLRAHSGQQLPQRKARPFGLQVPQGIHDGADRHVHDALFRAKPPQLGIVDQLFRALAHIRQQVFDIAAKDVGTEGIDGCSFHLVPAPDREHKAVAFKAVPCIRADDEVRRGVVRVRVHRIGAVQVMGRGEADVICLYCCDDAHNAPGNWGGWMPLDGRPATWPSSLAEDLN